MSAMTVSKRMKFLFWFTVFANSVHCDENPAEPEIIDLSGDAKDANIPLLMDPHYMMNQAMQRLHNLNEYHNFHNNYLKHILRLRVPGTLGHRYVKNFIVDSLKRLGWTVQLDEFTTLTPIGVRKFSNIVATLDPKALRVLAIAAHYDSKDPHSMKLGRGEYFLGATDSAVPCAMILDFAEQLSENWKYYRTWSLSMKVTPMIIFLDGEEAFSTWSQTDSLYGSRHLAKIFSTTPHHNDVLAAKGATVLDSLETFILLDLIGTKSPPPQFWDLYNSTSKLYSQIQDVENKLKDTLFGRELTYFPGKPDGKWEVEDDHKPFLDRGVPVLHLISIPFPESWHKVEDDERSLDKDTIINLLHILRQFLLEYFDNMSL